VLDGVSVGTYLTTFWILLADNVTATGLSAAAKDLAANPIGLPDIPEQLIALMGLADLVYIGRKMLPQTDEEKKAVVAETGTEVKLANAGRTAEIEELLREVRVEVGAEVFDESLPGATRAIMTAHNIELE